MCQPKFKLNGQGKGKNPPINDCMTNSSTSPCAWADAVGVATEADAATSFLACSLASTGPIALCYYSGKPGTPYMTPSCTLSPDKHTAECGCYEISANTTNAGLYSFVEISGILNKDVYNETVNVCEKDGSKCLNLSNVKSTLPEAPVCNAIANKQVFPGADLISDFSQIPIPNLVAANFPVPGDKGSFSQMCPTTGTENIYAACMTAPCKTTDKNDQATGFPIAKCTCPTYDGPNQVGNPQIANGPDGPPYSCSPNPHVWSSSYIEILPPPTLLPLRRIEQSWVPHSTWGPRDVGDGLATAELFKGLRIAGIV